MTDPLGRLADPPDSLRYSHYGLRTHLTACGVRIGCASDMISTVSEWEDAEVGRAPICPYCGVTALAAQSGQVAGSVIDPTFVCENPDCDAFGDEV